MSSLWEISTDTVVTAMIVVCISALAIAWLLTGRRRPAKDGSLEHRRLAGREAEVSFPPSTPHIKAVSPEPAPEELADDVLALAPQVEAPQSVPQEAPEVLLDAEAGAPLPSESAPDAVPQTPPAATAPPVVRSAEQTSAMSIAAALVRHDKREVAPSKPVAREAPLGAVSTGGDDLTAINGIDAKLAKEMNDLGIRYFDQIVSWAPDHAAWIASRLSSTVTVAQRTAWMAEAKSLVEQSAQANQSRTERAG